MSGESDAKRRIGKVARSRSVSAFIILVLLSIAAFLTRLMPISISRYPFNNDSLTSCGIASDILSSGHLQLLPPSVYGETHAGSTPAFGLLISFFSGCLGSAPLETAQLLVAVLAVLTIGGVFVLARMILGDLLGATTAGLTAILLGTFVFTTGSAWPEALGVSLFVLILISFVRRSAIEFRVLCFLGLMLIPLVHHLVAAVALITLAYVVLWSWYFAIWNRSLRKRNLLDMVTIAVPALWAVFYYSSVSLDRLSVFSSTMEVALLVSSFCLLGLVSVIVLSMKTHSKLTFAPVVGIAALILLVLSYYGYLFSYTPSSPERAYLLFAAFTSIIVAFSWFGAELIIEHRPVYRAIAVGLLLPPLTIMGYGLVRSSAALSQQIIYRTFDFLDIFIFLGVGAAIVGLRARHVTRYAALSITVVICLVLSFPYGYASEQLLGVRHDTQAYEVDTLGWLNDHGGANHLMSDERLSHVALSMFGFSKDASLPDHFKRGDQISSSWICLAEASWTTAGVNNYPMGLLVIPESNFTAALDASDVFYVGGPIGDQTILFTGSDLEL